MKIEKTVRVWQAGVDKSSSSGIEYDESFVGLEVPLDRNTERELADLLILSGLRDRKKVKVIFLTEDEVK